MSKANNGLFTSVINVYSFSGHRARKTVGSAATLFHYDLDGHLIAETNAAGAAVREFVRDDQGRPLAQFDSAGLSFLHFDHLGSPRFATNAAQAIVWSWKEKPYGTGAVTGSVTVPLRYPGQYFDAETGITQNWHRDYHAPSGRYLESDPVGVKAGVNTYGYVGGNPLSYTDPKGLQYQGIPLRSPVHVVTNSGWQGVFGEFGNLPVGPADWLPGDWPGVNTPPSVPTVPIPGKPVCFQSCPDDGNQCRPAPKNGIPSLSKTGCYTVCYETGLSAR